MEIHENQDGSVRWIQPYTLENPPNPGDVVALGPPFENFTVLGQYVVSPPPD